MLNNPATAKRDKTYSSVKLEKVNNVSGSTAGAGSGEHHNYRQQRRKEQDRLKRMDEEYDKKKTQEEFEKQKKERQDQLTEKQQKRTDKRKKRKDKKMAIKEMVKKNNQDALGENPKDDDNVDYDDLLAGLKVPQESKKETDEDDSFEKPEAKKQKIDGK
mmetsp:Transcript_20045/g.22699  ORF Transcript_20045/g.22699 Transcript_20045/m.22699 type:complete len:160 (+) Transcript_20045:48-527(+)